MLSFASRLLLAAAVACCGCKSGSLVVVKVSLPAAAARVHGSAEVAMQSRAFDANVAERPLLLAFELPDGLGGVFHVRVDAFDGAGAALGSAEDSVDVSRGGRAELSLIIDGVDGDLGPPDLAGADLAEARDAGPACDPSHPCAGGSRCVGNACVCDSQSCPTGCCDGSTCKPGTAVDACGTGGAACNACVAGAQYCKNQRCDCDATNCSGNRCCSQDALHAGGPTCVTTGDSACGVCGSGSNTCLCKACQPGWACTAPAFGTCE